MKDDKPEPKDALKVIRFVGCHSFPGKRCDWGLAEKSPQKFKN